MCIAIYKPAGAQVPSHEVLNRCWDSNPDGAGYCYVKKGGIVEGFKGFMDFDDFAKHAERHLTTEAPAILHFRIATHGGTGRSATHPFPLSCHNSPLKATHWTSNVGVAHNGIILGFGETRGAGLSDTQAFIAQVLADPNIRPRLFESEAIQYLIGEASSSKWILLRYDGRAVMFGSWQQANGVWFSNDGFKKWEKGSYSSWCKYRNGVRVKEEETEEEGMKWEKVSTKTETSKRKSVFHASCRFSPEDFAPKFCPFTCEEENAGVCLDCQFYDQKENYCELFEFDPN